MTHETRTTLMLGGMLLVALVLLLAAEPIMRHDRTGGQWSLMFVDPASSRLDIEIFNESPAAKFSYTVYEERRVKTVGSLEVQPGERKSIPFAELSAEKLSGKVRIRIEDESGQSREIFTFLDSGSL